MRKFLLAGAIVSCALLGSQAALAGAVVSGFNTGTVPRNDDGFVGPVALGFTANYFGSTSSTVFVNNNGNVTFNSGQSAYTPYGLGASYHGQPIIAPFFADVDTRNLASSQVTYGTGLFGGRDTFGVNWVNVGYYSSQADKLNSFQLLLVDRSDVAAGDFDMYFNYDRILWETGSASGGVNGFGGVPAAAGFSQGTGNAGTYYQFPGSLVTRALIDGGPNSLVAGTNYGVTGSYLFNVRNGNVIIPEDNSVPEPATWATMVLGMGIVGAALRRRQAARTTVSYTGLAA
ncbi:MAG: PEPxxWA-CTERM sorting domain-containing protein [Sphingomonadales bacterium]|nr:PEPxxWA-CTERM sorting domain-containing protein [Sphingomonadales bacterium]